MSAEIPNEKKAEDIPQIVGLRLEPLSHSHVSRNNDSVGSAVAENFVALSFRGPVIYC